MKSASNEIPLDDEGRRAVEGLARWLRITGSAQLGIASVAFAIVALILGCGVMAVGFGSATALLIAVIPVAVIAVYVLQALRTQAAGEQFGQIAQDADVDGLEFGFARLRTVFLIDAVVAILMTLLNVLGMLA